MSIWTGGGLFAAKQVIAKNEVTQGQSREVENKWIKYNKKKNTHTSLFSIARDSRPSRPPANHCGQRCGTGRLEGQCRWSQWVLAYLGGPAKLGRWSALVHLFATRVSVNSSHKPPSIRESVRFTHLPNSTGRRTVLHGAVSFRYMMIQHPTSAVSGGLLQYRSFGLFGLWYILG